jgi:uncharacterized protein with GYD domain
MMTATYTADGLKGLYRDKASGRIAAVQQALEGVGGRLECAYYALGEFDVVVIVDLPDTVVASAVSLAVSSSGLVRTRTTALLTVDETDKALATGIKYRAPGA